MTCLRQLIRPGERLEMGCFEQSSPLPPPPPYFFSGSHLSIQRLSRRSLLSTAITCLRKQWHFSLPNVQVAQKRISPLLRKQVLNKSRLKVQITSMVHLQHNDSTMVQQYVWSSYFKNGWMEKMIADFTKTLYNNNNNLDTPVFKNASLVFHRPVYKLKKHKERFVIILRQNVIIITAAAQLWSGAGHFEDEEEGDD